MPPEPQLFRGYYGSSPVGSVSGKAWRLAGLRVLWAEIVNVIAGLRLTFRPLEEDELKLLHKGAEQVVFPMWCPERVPAGFEITGCKAAPYSRDSVTITLQSQTGKSFEIAQRRRWLPVLEELKAAHLPFHKVLSAQGKVYVVHGRHGGEPIDRAFWSTRQSVHFERDDVRLEFREVRCQGPGLSTLIRFAKWACGALPASQSSKIGEQS